MMLENIPSYSSLFSLQLNIILIIVLVYKFLKWYRFQSKAVKLIEELIQDTSKLSIDKDIFKSLVTASFDNKIDSYKNFFSSLEKQVQVLIDEAVDKERKNFSAVSEVSSVDDAIALNQKLKDDLSEEPTAEQESLIDESESNESKPELTEEGLLDLGIEPGADGSEKEVQELDLELENESDDNDVSVVDENALEGSEEQVVDSAPEEESDVHSETTSQGEDADVSDLSEEEPADVEGSSGNSETQNDELLEQESAEKQESSESVTDNESASSEAPLNNTEVDEPDHSEEELQTDDLQSDESEENILEIEGLETVEPQTDESLDQDSVDAQESSDIVTKEDNADSEALSNNTEVDESDRTEEEQQTQGSQSDELEDDLLEIDMGDELEDKKEKDK